jgi:cytochrome P450
MPSPDRPVRPAPADTDRVVLSRHGEVTEAFRPKQLRQALYDEGGVVMAGTLLDLHGDAHRARRRLENRLFRRETFSWFEHEMIAPIIDAVLAGPVRAGGADLVEVGYRAVMHLTAQIAGVDRPEGTDEESDALLGHVVAFGRGATLVHAEGDRDALRGEVAVHLAAFDRRFFAPSVARRRALADAVATGSLERRDLPRDVLMLLVDHATDLGLDLDTMRREVAFYLQAGGHSTANALTHALDEIFRWAAVDADRLALLRDDPIRLQRAVHESLRLHPASPQAWRRALADCRLASGRDIRAGEVVVLDLTAANCDPDVWGPDADTFDPGRTVPAGVAPWGLSFGAGMHACIGAELDGGTQPDPTRTGDHLLGTVTLLVRAFLHRGARPDPQRPPVRSTSTQRPHFERYPVVFA